MNDLQLLGPRAYGEALGSAILKATAEDFQVDEVLDIPLTGEGEHLWLWVEKRGLNTEEAARRIAKAAGVPLRTVSYAGLKDRQALTRQWFSVQLPGKADPDLSGAENDTLKILKTGRHKRKLQRGAHSANGFTLRLTQLAGDHAAIDARLQLIAQQGLAGAAQCAFAVAVDGAQFPLQQSVGSACRGRFLAACPGRRSSGLHRQSQFFSGGGG